MAILDVVLLVVAVAVMARGVVRGASQTSLELLVVVLAALAAFRLNGPVGAVVALWSGAESLPARFIAGGVLFIGTVVLGSYAAAALAHRFSGAMTPWSRALGAVFSLAWLTVLASVLLLTAVALPLDDSANGVLAHSKVVASLTDPGSPAYGFVTALDPDRVLEAMVNLDRVIGNGQVVIQSDDRVSLVPSTDIAADRAAGVAIFDLLNLARVDAGLKPLAWSEALAEVGDAHAREMYQEGFFSHSSPSTGTVADRVQAAGIPYLVIGENLALAPTVDNVHEGLLASPGHRANMLERRFRRVGIGVYHGPLGLMVVEVFQG